MSQRDKDYEKLGVFYLGRRHRFDTGETLPEPFLYDSKDLTTHGMVVGMTGSGKTGLCLSLLEDAGIDGIPALVIDPKGDIANLLLTFPELRAQDFEPWVEPAEAVRKGLSPAEYAKSEAKKWRDGLAKWDQDPERIQMFRDSVELALYTPGSTTARPLSLLREFAPPPEAVLNDPEMFHGQIASAVSGLLGLMGLDADPMRSREHILLSKLLELAWTQGQHLGLPQLIGQLQNPPLTHVGVLDLETFFPAKDRSGLAMSLNNLLASPTFSTWMTGEPLEIGNLLYTRSGRPKISILSIAHLNDSQRMFFVTLLLNELISWMRNQPGTSSLRAILYMDEVFGFFPPTANPPSKTPMLTLLKQARAYGVGVLLATQNPVDLDYKGLSNIGTWFLGRLQTERDKQRILDGLEGAAAASGHLFSRGEVERILSGLGQRRFLMNNVHDSQPLLFETRWAMSYLRGPLTRDQLKRLSDDLAGPEGVAMADSPAEAPGKSAPVPSDVTTVDRDTATDAPPNVILPAGIQPKYLAAKQPVPTGQRVVYRPGLLATGRLHFVAARQGIDRWEERTYLTSLPIDLPPDVWCEADEMSSVQCLDEGLAGQYTALPAEAASAKSFDLWNRQFLSYLYREAALELYRCPALKLDSEPGQSEGEFRVSLRQVLAEQRDLQTEKLRQKFASKFSSLDDRIQRAQQRIETEQERQKQRKWDTALSMGQTILGALLGRKTISTTTINKTTSTIKKAGQAASGQSKVRQAEDSLENLVAAKGELEQEFEQAIAEIKSQLNADQIELTPVQVTPRKSDLSVLTMQFVWLPFAVDPTGIAEPLFR